MYDYDEIIGKSEAFFILTFMSAGLHRKTTAEIADESTYYMIALIILHRNCLMQFSNYKTIRLQCSCIVGPVSNGYSGIMSSQYENRIWSLRTKCYEIKCGSHHKTIYS